MLPEASGETLVYATGGCSGTCVISYPVLKLVGELSTHGNAACSDSAGNVFILADGSAVEYAHGGTEPIATLGVGGNPSGCSVDPTTNTLAVVAEGNIVMFQDEKGRPTNYPTGLDLGYCGFDDKGNLFTNGYSQSGVLIEELPAGGSEFSKYTLPNTLNVPGQVQWDGQYITYQTQDRPTISRISIFGSKATIVGTVTFKGMPHRQFQSWIYQGNVIIPLNVHGESPNVVGVWRYPKGERMVDSIRKFPPYKKSGTWFWGVTISVAPSK